MAKQDSSTMGQGRERLETKFRAKHRAFSRVRKTNIICECAIILPMGTYLAKFSITLDYTVDFDMALNPKQIGELLKQEKTTSVRLKMTRDLYISTSNCLSVEEIERTSQE